LRPAALIWLFAATAASGQTNPGATYDPEAVVQAICRQYAAAQTGMPVDTMFAPPCAVERLRQRMEGGPTIARCPVPVMEEPQRVGDEFERR
jgi:hypothetical protein